MTNHTWVTGAVILCVVVSLSPIATVPLPASTGCEADVILVIDKSGSMRSYYTELLEFCKKLVAGLDPRSKIGIVVFDHVASTAVEIGDYTDLADLMGKIDVLPRAGGGTAIYLGIIRMHEMFKASARFANKVRHRFTGIVMTDGADGSTSRLIDAATAAHKDDINIISIGLGRVNTVQIKAIASDPDYALIKPSVSHVGTLLDKVVDLTCNAVKPGVKRPPKDECFRTSYTHGQLWLQYKPNCHQYIVCEPRGPGKYVKHIMSCGNLYWNQKWHACSRQKTGDCLDVSAITTPVPGPTSEAPCPYKRNTQEPGAFYSIYDKSQVQHCPIGQEFSEKHCTCLVVFGQVPAPKCNDDLLLHFANDTTDHTCHRAVLNLYGDGTVLLVSDPSLNHNAAEFDGRGYLEVPFIRTWFANNHVDAFSISLWFNRQGNTDAKYGALVNNGDGVQKAGFCLRIIENDKLVGKIRTGNGDKSVTVIIPSSPTGWHHVAYVYNGQRLTMTVDNSAASSVAITGYMVNTDVPMNVAFSDGKYFFKGLMAEFKMYSRALSPTEIAAMYNALKP